MDRSSRAAATTSSFHRSAQGDLPAYRFGRVIRVKRSDVDAFVEASRIEPGTLDHLSPDSRADSDDE